MGSEPLTLGALIRLRRSETGLSLQQVAEQVFCTKGHLSRVERGEKSLTEELARALDRVLRTTGEFAALARAVPVPARQDTWSRPAQLPAKPRDFVGREYQLTKLTKLLSPSTKPGSVPVVALDGQPGVGKTSLALQWAHQAAELFPDGQLYVDLHGFGPVAKPAEASEVLGEFLRALGIPGDRIPAQEAHRATAFRSLLHGRRVLIVLDNAADSQQVRPLLPGSPGCAVLVTSRRRLKGLVASGSGVCVTLNALSPNEALRLIRLVTLHEGSWDIRVDDEPEALLRLAGLCAHLPLALRIAAEILAAQPHLGVAKLADDLVCERTRLNLLTVGDEDALEVRNVFSWSYFRLAEPTGRMFRLLGLHPGTAINTGAAAALAGVCEDKARMLLDELVTARLVEQVGQYRYQAHDLLRDYAIELTTELDDAADRDAAILRLLDWYLHTVDAVACTVAPQRGHPLLQPCVDGVQPLKFLRHEDAVAWCESESATFEAITRLAAEHHCYGHAWRLPVALYDFLLANRPAMWVSMHTVAVAAAQAAGDRFGEAWAVNDLGEGYRCRHDLDEAEKHFLHALELRRDIGDRVGEGWSLTCLGYTALDRQVPADAVHYFGRALAIFGEVGARDGEVSATASLGDAYRRLGDLQSAERHLSTALRLFDDFHDPHLLARTLTGLGHTCGDQGLAAEALDWFEQASAMHLLAGDRWACAELHADRARLLHRTGRVTEAQQWWARALAAFREIDLAKADELQKEIRETSADLPPD
jgi:tetratricopeptide (TPR) repeat protein/transcriptional regulator with XRE-family HTH domain